MGVLSDDDLTAMRRRARHRLIGALGFVVLLVIGVPQLIDRRGPAPGAEQHADPSRTLAAAGTPGMPTVETGPPDAAAAARAGARTVDAAGDDPAAAATGSTVPAKAGPTAGDSATADPRAAASKSAGPPGGGSKTAEPAAGGSAAPAAAGVEGGAASALAAASTGKSSGQAQPAPALVPDTVPPIDPQAAALPGKTRRTQRAERGQTGAAARSTSQHVVAHAAEPAVLPASAPHARGWFVQIGVFSEAARAGAVAEQLESKGVHVHREVIHGPRGALTRVRAGPFPSRGNADEVLARVKTLGENAILVHQ